MNFCMHRGEFCEKYTRAKAEIFPVPVLEANSSRSLLPPCCQSKGHLQIRASAQPGGHEPQGWSLQSCSALQPTAEQNLIVRQAASCRKPGWGALCSALLASGWRATGGSSTRAPSQQSPAGAEHTAEPGWSCKAPPARVQAKALPFT